MIKKHKGFAISDFIDILLDNGEWDSCGFTDDGTYAFIFDDNDNVLFSEEKGIHELLINQHTNIKKGVSNYENKVWDYLNSHTNGRIFTNKKSLALRGYDILTKKECLKLIEAAKEKINVDISNYTYYIGDDETRENTKEYGETQDVYSIKLSSYIVLNKFTLDGIRSTFKKLVNKSDSKVDKYDSFDIKDSKGRYMGIGKLGYHLLAYQEGKEYNNNNKINNILKFDEFFRKRC